MGEKDLTKYLRNIFIFIAIALFIASFLTVNKDEKTTSFILSVCAVALTFVGVFTKPGNEAQTEKAPDKKSGTPFANIVLWIINHITDPASLLNIVLQPTLGAASIGMIFGFFGEISSKPNYLFDMIAKNTGTLFANVLYGGILGAVLGAGLMLFLVLYFSLILAGIVIGNYVFNIKFKYISLFYGALASVFSLFTIITVWQNIIGGNPFGLWLQVIFAIWAIIMGVIIGVAFIKRNME